MGRGRERMHRTFLSVSLLFLLVAPLALAHEPAGTPKTHCEDPSEWSTHDYATGLPQPSQAKQLQEAVQEAVADLPLRSMLSVPDERPRDGNLSDCNGDLLPIDFDHHFEFGYGIAVLAVDSSPASAYCLRGQEAHHPSVGLISIQDALHGSQLDFTVAVDTIDLIPDTHGGPQCGDFQDDQASVCFSSCLVTFIPGLDGAYHVYPGLTATMGHITS